MFLIYRKQISMQDKLIKNKTHDSSSSSVYFLNYFIKYIYITFILYYGDLLILFYELEKKTAKTKQKIKKKIF